ncbi:glyoxylase-like metal-dependent hydrolase (beta-lactamase superfamily II) [Pedobacter cryoconitis]|uniref:Glyoxylase-like metal-dependent hydrolase (Beta-lactamase superfamily II) n=1 Tax=Pedobacter cryoconitis TaxID=188932 RepID=A0A7W9DJ60_9SPHI|nr:MBL fold metallo-hydrolase [Pedobacter cryoconitis]MBB5620841.1 glyoxylase-like metal-dependent hydrolase (beta-lactamase superfamily II) [Pedobacter cryoconitis]
MKRRQLLKYAGVLGILTSLPTYKLNAQAPIPGLGVNSPSGYVKFKLGKLDLLVVTDGHIFIHPAQPIFAPGINTVKVKEALAENFMLDDAVDAAINILVIKKEKRIIIIDTGSGSAIGDQAGRFIKNLNSAGIKADDITDVFVTHLHVDHIGGILDGDGKLIFKNAMYYLSQKEYNFWMSENPDFSQSKNKNSNEGSIVLARNIIAAVNDKLKLYNFGETLFDCITANLAEGHTPGHPVLKIVSENESLTHIVDTVHTTLLLSHPEWGTEWDIDFHKGVSTRTKILREQSKSKGLTMSCHLPWPGLGYITKKGDGYSWVQMPISTPYI